MTGMRPRPEVESEVHRTPHGWRWEVRQLVEHGEAPTRKRAREHVAAVEAALEEK